MSAAHTPGPWVACRIHEDFDGPMWDLEPDERPDYDARPFVKIVAEDGTCVTSAHDLFEFKPEDARLIAAAPELLKALQNLDANPELTSAWLQARAAIAKATGVA